MTLTELQDRKLTKRFQLMDTDGNGVIERADYELLVDRLLTAYGVAADSAIAKELRSAYLKLWMGLAYVFGTNKVTLAEFKSAVVRGVLGRDDGFEQVILPATAVALRLADVDGDGRVSHAEFARLMAVYGVPEDEGRRCAKSIDTDNDGDVSLDELIAADRDFYLSDAPDAPGNAFFGRF